MLLIFIKLNINAYVWEVLGNSLWALADIYLWDKLNKIIEPVAFKW